MTASVGAVSTVFTQDSLFSSLSAAQFNTASPQALSLRLFSDPLPFSGVQDQPITVLGASAELPALFSQPYQINLGNLVLLAQSASGIDLGAFFGNSSFDILANALLSRPPPLSNPAERIINEVFPFQETEAIAEEDPGIEIGPITGPDVRFSDFLQRPSENAAFGTTFSSVASDSSVNAYFFTRVGLASSESVTISDLLLNTPDVNVTDYAVSLTGENGAAAVGSLNLSGSPVTNGTVITAADLANLTYSGPASGLGLDNLSLIDLRDDNNDDVFEGRGSFQTITLTSSGEVEARRDGDERIRDFFFGAETASAQSQVVLRFSDINSLGFTDALSAINGGALRVRAVENRADGTVNTGITNLYESSANQIVIRFPFLPTQNGVTGGNIQVELRALDLSFDLSPISVFSIFG